MSGSGGRYRARQAATEDDIRAAQALRYLCFRGAAGEGPGAQGEGLDVDLFDARAIHVMVEEAATGRLVCCYRMLHFRDGSEIEGSYSAQFYELAPLRGYRGAMVEMGRFCIAPGVMDPDVLRVAWGAMAAHVERHGVELLFGCSSFRGTETDAYLDAFALLKERHIAPKRWLPRVKAPRVFRFASRLRVRKPDLRAAMRAMPPLLRTYLAMGGWVSDHAVVDRDLGTLHVFTGVEIKAVPAGRVRLLQRAAAG
jgi:L-ornithine Nalpha-acyltransferase